MRRGKLKTRWAVVAAASLAAIIVGAVVMAGAAMAADHQVTVQGFAFAPASITVNAGDSITWTNKDPAAHTVTADGGSFDQPLPANGGTATITFNTAGTFPYHCTIHPNMHGTVVVVAAASTGTATTSPSASPAAGTSPAAGGTSTVTAPATGSGTAGPAASWSPLWMLAGGLLVAVGLGGGALALARRDD